MIIETTNEITATIKDNDSIEISVILSILLIPILTSLILFIKKLYKNEIPKYLDILSINVPNIIPIPIIVKLISNLPIIKDKIAIIIIENTILQTQILDLS